MKKDSILQFLIVCAIILSGLLAGETFDRLVIGVAAWRHVPIESWALYSRNADLSTGAFVYPVEAIGTSLILIWVFIIILRNKPIYHSMVLPVAIATFLSMAGLLFTFFAAPWMLRLKTSGDEAEALQNIFDHFYFWSTCRGVVQILCFPACVWCLTRSHIKGLD